MSEAQTLTSSALERLCRAVGKDWGEKYAREALHQLGLRELSTPDDLLRFANYLCAKGGVVEAVGRALRVSALLLGARDV